MLLRYKVAGDEVKTSLVTEKDGDGGTFSLLMVPPETTEKLPRRALEVIHAIDVYTDTRAESALLRADLTGAGDTNRIADGVNGNVLLNALRLPHDPTRLRVVCLVTDGRGDWRSRLSALPAALGDARILVFGVGQSPDRNTIDAIAREGRGAAVYLQSPNDLDSAFAVINQFRHPAISDIQIDWKGAQVSDLLPMPLTDLFVGHAIMVTGRYGGAPPAIIGISGNAGDKIRQWTVTSHVADLPGRTPIASVWARRKIASLASEAVAHQSDRRFEQQIRDIAVEHGLLSRYTAFITVDAMTQAAQK